MAILYVASEASELEPFAAFLTGLRKVKWPIDYAWEGILEGRRVLLAANGAGPKLAAQALEIAIRAVASADLSSSRLEAVVSTGYCGALDATLLPSQIVIATQVLDLATQERYDCIPVSSDSDAHFGLVASQNCIANDTTEKQRLRTQSGAIAVEMESVGVAGRAKRAGLPFCCIKVVSDGAGETFPLDFNRLRTIEGRIARGKIVMQAIAHPLVIPGLFRLKRRTEDAARVLGDFLVSCRISSDITGVSVE